MAESAFPFDAGPGANVLENSWQKMAREWLTTGVISDRLSELAVSADGSALAVSVAAGQAQVEGFFYENDAALSKTLGTANATNPRIDTVVVRLDRTANTATVEVVAGTPAASPAAPALTQTDALYELPLADVTVPAAAGVIVAGNVTDRRTYTKNLTEAAASAAYVAKADTSATATFTSETTTSTAYTDLATVGPSIAFTAPASGRVRIQWSARMSNGTAGTTCYAGMDLSGPTAVAVSDTRALEFTSSTAGAALNATAPALIYDGLTPGGAYTLRMKYRVTGGTGTFSNRRMMLDLL